MVLTNKTDSQKQRTDPTRVQQRKSEEIRLDACPVTRQHSGNAGEDVVHCHKQRATELNDESRGPPRPRGSISRAEALAQVGGVWAGRKWRGFLSVVLSATDRLAARKTKIACRRCTSSPSPDTFSEIFGASPCSRKEIAGLKKKKKKKKKMKNMMTQKCEIA